MVILKCLPAHLRCFQAATPSLDVPVMEVPVFSDRNRIGKTIGPGDKKTNQK